jgi:Lon protease-like protein
VGYLVGADQLPDGRYHIVLRGVARVSIEEELPPARAYREVRARLLVDHVAQPELLTERREQLVAMCDRLAAMLGERGRELRELTRKLESPATCADVLAATLVRDVDERQALLEESDPAVRLETLTGHVAGLLVELAPPGGLMN